MSDTPLLEVTPDAVQRVAFRNGLGQVSELLSDIGRRMMASEFDEEWLDSITTEVQPKPAWVKKWGQSKAEEKAHVLVELAKAWKKDMDKLGKLYKGDTLDLYYVHKLFQACHEELYEFSSHSVQVPPPPPSSSRG